MPEDQPTTNRCKRFCGRNRTDAMTGPFWGSTKDFEQKCRYAAEVLRPSISYLGPLFLLCCIHFRPCILASQGYPCILYPALLQISLPCVYRVWVPRVAWCPIRSLSSWRWRLKRGTSMGRHLRAGPGQSDEDVLPVAGPTRQRFDVRNHARLSRRSRAPMARCVHVCAYVFAHVPLRRWRVST